MTLHEILATVLATLGTILALLMSVTFTDDQRKRYPALRLLDGKQIYFTAIVCFCIVGTAALQFIGPPQPPIRAIRNLDAQLRLKDIVPRLETELSSGRHLPSSTARRLAQQIPEEASPYALALRAVAERDFKAARPLLLVAENEYRSQLLGAYINAARIDVYEGTYLRAVASYERARRLAPGDTTVLTELAIALADAGRFAEARRLTERLLTASQALKPATAETITQLNNLALLMVSEGRFEEAAKSLADALTLGQRLSPEGSHATARTRCNLGWLYANKDQADLANSNLKAALDIERALPDPDVLFMAEVYNRLGGLARGAHDLVRARIYYGRTRAIYEENVGLTHPALASVFNNLAVVARIDNDLPSAEAYLERSLTLSRAALGTGHPDVATVLNNQARLYEEQGLLDKADGRYRQALAIRSAGPNPLATAQTLNHLGALYQKQERYAKAEELLQRALTIRERELGPDHIDVSETLNNLGTLYLFQARYAEAEPRLKRTLDIRTQRLGKDHPRTATAMANLASCYHLQGSYPEARDLFENALAVFRTRVGEDSPDAATTMIRVGEVYIALKQEERGIDYMRRGLAILRNQVGSGHPRTQNALRKAVSVLEKLGRENEASRLKEEYGERE